jgi:protein-serine/threonine kinase
MDPNRLHLNFGNNNERLASSDRTYPTTPSTFPQPVFPNPSQQQQQQQTQQHSAVQPPQAAQQYAAGYAPPNSYFAQGPYQPQYAPQQQAVDYSNQSAAYQPRSNTPGTNDPNVGLAHQFSHQNLGGAARGNAYGARASPAQSRPRTAGSAGQQPSYSYPTAPMPTRQPEFQVAPERNPEKYGSVVNNNQKKCSQLAADFFKDSVKRARERNLR